MSTSQKQQYKEKKQEYLEGPILTITILVFELML